MFEKQLIELGEVKKGDVVKVSVKYTGDAPFDRSGLTTSCTCTNAVFDESTKFLTMDVHPKGQGDFQSIVTYTPNRKDFYHIVIKAKIL